MKSYEQACGLAKALDVVGDRWSMLIVRELLIREACRYSDLRRGLPGVATNLLADRLRELEKAGLVARRPAAPPFATDLFHLTERGLALEPALLSLGQWGAARLQDAKPSDVFQAHWLVLPLRLHLGMAPSTASPFAIVLDCDGEQIAIEIDGEGRRVRMGTPAAPAARVCGPGQAVLALMTGRIEFDAASAAGIEIEGDRAAVAAVIAHAPIAKPPSVARR